MSPDGAWETVHDGYTQTEIVFQDFEIPLSAFTEADPAFDPSRLTSVRFVFDRKPGKGVVVLDDLGFVD